MKATIVLGSLMLLIAATAPAYAYIDPGTGSVVTTAIIGFFAAAAYTFRKYWYKITDFFSGKTASRVDKENAGE